ncbi:MAG: acetylglutamate kinase [Candidatus Eisenbacteria bacterium]|nr:acetylglutamate kinase [Candidatus Eisenbacteria bacterium]
MTLESGISLEAAAPFVKHFRGSTFVVKLSGAVLDDAGATDAVAAQLALLDALGIRLVLVHGGGAQADRLGERLGVPQKRVAGRRVTDDATLEVVSMAFSGPVRNALLGALRRHGLSAVGLSGLDARLTSAVKRPPLAVREAGGPPVTTDFGHVGDIAEVHPGVLRDLMEAGHVPVVTSLAGDDEGHLYNVNADTLAAALAAALGAAKLVLLTTVPGLLRDVAQPSSVISCLDLEACREMADSGAVGGGMLPKLEACRNALLKGVDRVHLVDGLKPNALLREIFTNEGCGTLIVRRREDADGSGEAWIGADVPVGAK